MKNILQKLFRLNKNISYIDTAFSNLREKLEVKEIFDAFSKYGDNIQIRFVGGCVRKILSNEKVDDIDLATNVNPNQVKSILEKNNISFFETGIDHGTITASINNIKFEITSLRKDVLTYGRHAKVEYLTDWKLDASRRDFTINSIYADIDGNLFDPFDGKKDLSTGQINFIGKTEKRIKEDYLRILRYIRFFILYSKKPHDKKTQISIRQNLSGIKNVSKERLLDEIKKIFLIRRFEKIINDTFLMEILELIFPEMKNLKIFKNLNDEANDLIRLKDFIFLLCLTIIDGSDNANYFLFKYNVSNENKKRISFLKDNFNNIKSNNFFTETNLKKLYFKNNKLLVEDLIDFKIFHSKKMPKNILKIKNTVLSQPKPIFPIKAKELIDNYNLREGRDLGQKLKKLEDIWLINNFKINHDDIKKILKT